MKRINLPKFHWAKLLSIFFFILLFGAYSNILAIGQKYNPGDTLDPACSPGEVNCTVLISAGGGTPGGSDTQIQFNNNGSFGGSSGFTWVGGSEGSPFSVGPDVTFTKADYEVVSVTPPVTDNISQYVHLARNNVKGIYNAVTETFYDWNTNLSPAGTEWNSDGWGDISNVESRTYVSMDNAVGRFGDNILTKELVMHDIQDDKYYKFQFTSWSSNKTGGTGGFAYTRTLINPDFSLGTVVNFTRPDSIDVPPTDDISPSVHLTRGEAKGLYNAVNESFYDNNTNIDPTGTEWNSDGWGDLTDVATRTYTTFYEALSQSIGDNIIGAELVMHDIDDDKYYKFSFNSWTSSDNGAGGGGFSYTRNLITLPGDVPGRLSASANLLLGGKYLNFGTNFGGAGYGIRDNAGTIQYKNSGGSWVDVIGGVFPVQVVNISNLFSTGLEGTGSGVTNTEHSIFLGIDSGNNATNASYSNFFGEQAGYQATNAAGSNFLGDHAGYQATNAEESQFIGNSAGSQSTNAEYSNFIGSGAGSSAAEAHHSNFFGMMSGYGATNASESNFFGSWTGIYATDAEHSNFLGDGAGNGAAHASNSNFLGNNAGQSSGYSTNSNFFGYYAGAGAVAPYSNLFGYSAGKLFSGNNIGSNNIIIGTNISLPNNTTDAINLGGILFGKNTYSTITGNPSIDATPTGSIGIGVVSPTARLQLPAGTATAGTAPLKFTNGTNLSTTEAGAVEYDGSHLYFTATNGGTRYQLDQQGGGGLSSDADFNTKGGTDAGLNLVAGAQYNTFLGYEAGKGGSVTNAADFNTAIGYQSLYSNTTGSANTANGYSSLYSNTTGYGNTANGLGSLRFNTTGSDNTATGYNSLYSNITGFDNTANGFNSLFSNITGSDNTATGYQSLNSNTGNYNTANGSQSLSSNTTGENNAAFGYGSLFNNTSGYYNTAFGSEALVLNTTGHDNSAFGNEALNKNKANSRTTAIGANAMFYADDRIIGRDTYNTAVGYQSLYGSTIAANNIGQYNTAIGDSSLRSNTSGSYNSALGFESLYSNTTGSENNASGYYSLYSNTTGWNDTSSGSNSLYSNTTGYENTAYGSYALYSNSTGIRNTSSGTNSLSFNTTGGGNTADGYNAGAYIIDGTTGNITGSNSLFLGYNTRALADGQTNQIVIGASAIGNGSNTATIGNTSLLRTYLTGLNLKAGTATAGTAPLKFTSGTVLGTTEAGAVEYDGTHLYFTATNGGTRYQLDQQGGGLSSDADFNTKGGTSAGLNLVAGAQYNTFLGYEAGKGGVVTNTADNNTANGFRSLYLNTTGSNNTATGSVSLYSNTTGVNNTASGYSALYSNTTGSNNTANGNSSLFSNTTGSQNTANGANSLAANTSGSANTANGTSSLFQNTTGSGNTANGNGSLSFNTTGNYNTANGGSSLSYNTIGNNNTANGYGSLANNTTGSANTNNGYQSLYNNTTGSNNTASGTGSLSYNTTGNNNTADGYNALYNSGRTIMAGSFITGISYTIQITGSTDFTLIGAANSSPGTVFTATGVGSGSGQASSNTNNNTAIGYYAGRYAGAGSTANIASYNSLYLGYDTRASADGNNNEIVIGYNTTGNGSNTTTLGTGNVLYVGGSSISGKAARFTNSAGYCDINPLTTSLSCTSDITLKKNITTLDNKEFNLREDIDVSNLNTLDKLLTLTPVTYNWNKESDTDTKHIGFIAQEMEQVFPDLVFTDNNTGIKSIAFTNLIPYTIEAIKEMDLKVKDLDEKIKEVTLSGMMSDFFSGVVTNVSDGVLYMKGLAVETLKIGSPEKRTGITLYDEVTGDPYCLSVANGTTKTVQGECGIITPPEPVVESPTIGDTTILEPKKDDPLPEVVAPTNEVTALSTQPEIDNQTQGQETPIETPTTTTPTEVNAQEQP